MLKISTFKRMSNVTDPPSPRWYFRVRAANGKIIAQSEAYNSLDAAEDSARLLMGPYNPLISAEEDQ